MITTNAEQHLRYLHFTVQQLLATGLFDQISTEAEAAGKVVLAFGRDSFTTIEDPFRVAPEIRVKIGFGSIPIVMGKAPDVVLAYDPVTAGVLASPLPERELHIAFEKSDDYPASELAIVRDAQRLILDQHIIPALKRAGYDARLTRVDDLEVVVSEVTTHRNIWGLSMHE